MDAPDLAAVWLTLKLATVVTLLLLLVGTPIAWWLARTRSAFKGVVGAVVLAAAPEAGVPVRGARQFRLRRRQSLSLPLVPG